MANRNLLPKHFLDAFKEWLVARGHEHRPTTANYQVLQVRLKGKLQWHSIFYRDTRNPHYTVPDPLVKITNRFVFDHKYGKNHPAPRNETPGEPGAQAEVAGGDPAPEGDDSPPF